MALRLVGGLHALVLGGRDAALAAAYGGAGDPVAAALAAIHAHDAFLHGWLDSPPQTNEVRRSAALIAAAHWLHMRAPLPLVISEAGASAGLNLLWDRYAMTAGGQGYGPADPVLHLAPDWRGAPPPAPAPVRVIAREGRISTRSTQVPTDCACWLMSGPISPTDWREPGLRRMRRCACGPGWCGRMRWTGWRGGWQPGIRGACI